MDEDERFAAAVKLLREDKGWSQAELSSRLQEAGLTQFHPTTVSRVENGTRTVKFSEARAFARVLSVSLDAMIAEPELSTFIADLRGRYRKISSLRERIGEICEELQIECIELLDLIERRSNHVKASAPPEAIDDLQSVMDDIKRIAEDSLAMLKQAGFRSSVVDSDDSAS